VLEARDRVGGRVHSRRLDNGAVVELGAEFVLPGYDVLRETAARLGLELYEKGTLYGDREPRDGPPVTRDELLAADVALRDPGPGSIAEALERLVPSEGARAAIAARLAVSSAYELEDQDASALAEGATRFGDFPSHGVSGGNDRIALGLAEPRSTVEPGGSEWTSGTKQSDMSLAASTPIRICMSRPSSMNATVFWGAKALPRPGRVTGRSVSGTGTIPQASQWMTGMGQPQ